MIGSQARVMYIDPAKLVVPIIKTSETGDTRPIVLGPDHHDVPSTVFPYREPSYIIRRQSIYCKHGIQNFKNECFKGATWIFIHNGGSVGWVEVINEGFGMVFDIIKESEEKLDFMLF